MTSARHFEKSWLTTRMVRESALVGPQGWAATIADSSPVSTTLTAAGVFKDRRSTPSFPLGDSRLLLLHTEVNRCILLLRNVRE